MEEKLTFGRYTCFDDYVSDFDQMVENRVFSDGPRHRVTKDGLTSSGVNESIAWKHIERLVDSWLQSQSWHVNLWLIAAGYE